MCLTHRGTQFYANKQKNKEQGVSEFEGRLAKLGIKKHSKCRYKHPQTNGKFEKWNHTYELHRHRFNSFNKFIEWSIIDRTKAWILKHPNRRFGKD